MPLDLVIPRRIFNFNRRLRWCGKITRFSGFLNYVSLHILISFILAPESSLPTNWTSQPDHKVFHLVKLDSSSQEYLEVLNHFVARGGNASQLYMVERIQNPQLYLRYLAFKNSMRGQVNEMRLFHGTDAANIDSINAKNFNRSFAGVNGKGICYPR